MSAFVYLAALLAAGVFAIFGWLLDRPDDVPRFRARFGCALCLGVCCLIIVSFNERLWSFWWWVGIVALLGTYSWVQREYRRLETARRFHREVARARGRLR